jgi:hypothetical protein
VVLSLPGTIHTPTSNGESVIRSRTMEVFRLGTK